MRFFPNSCCLCFKLHQAFIYIIYLDMIRLLWVVLFTILLFLKPYATVIDYAFNAVILSATFSECFNALKSLNYGFMKNEYIIHRKYLMAKTIFVFANLIKLCSVARLNCSLRQGDQECIEKQLDAQFSVDVVWTFFEMYCTLVVYSFCLKVGKGFYGPVGGSPIFPDFNLMDLGMYKEGICLETKGVKVKNYLGKDLEVGVNIIGKGKDLHDSNQNKASYWKIFPKPLFRWNLVKKEVEMCDLIELQERN